MFAALCDDDKYITDEVKNLLLEYAKKSRVSITVDEYPNGEELLNSDKNYDIIILDYQLGTTDGLSVARELKKRSAVSSIIFLTAYPQFMIDAFEVNTFRFLLKPIDKAKLFQALDDYVRIAIADYPITIIENKEIKKIKTSSICFVEADGKYSKIHLNNKIIHCSKTLAAVAKLLPSCCFVKTHRSFVVNLHYVKSFSSNMVFFTNGESAFISKTYCNSFKSAYLNFLEQNYVRL